MALAHHLPAIHRTALYHRNAAFFGPIIHNVGMPGKIECPTLMKVLIANPALRFRLEGENERYFFGAGCRFPWSLRKDRKNYPRFAMFPFFLGYTAALLEKDGFDVKVIDGVPLNLTQDEFIRRAVEVKPELIVFEPATPAINWVSRLARELVERTGAKICFAGSHVTSFP